MLQFDTPGVVNPWREWVDRDYRRHLQVAKMRGVDHATRQFEVEIGHEVSRSVRCADAVVLQQPHRERGGIDGL